MDHDHHADDVQPLGASGRSIVLAGMRTRNRRVVHHRRQSQHVLKLCGIIRDVRGLFHTDNHIVLVRNLLASGLQQRGRA
jgi:hypothetical protein